MTRKKDTSPASRRILQDFLNVCGRIDSSYTRLVSASIKDVGAFKAFREVGPPQPDLYSESLPFANDWMVYNLLRKLPDLPGSTEKMRMKSTVGGWIAAETRCAETNRRFLGLMSGTVHPPERLGSVGGAALLLEAQRQITLILGPFNRKALLAECKWSQGATATTKRGFPLSKKHSSGMVATLSASKYVDYVLNRDTRWLSSIVGTEVDGPCSLYGEARVIVPGSRTSCVPKTAYTHRTIGMEPLFNGFLQQGFGRWLRARLRKWGCDLDDQSINRKRAQLAYVFGWCTLDLESASDSVALSLVRFLFPERFYDYLCDIRSTRTCVGDGKWVRLEKLSSMGNACTFEVESLIFLALARACEVLLNKRDTSSVYGDDIVVDREVGHTLIPLLEYCGFALNTSKTFLSGNFFESCGGHYFKGVDVTPPVQDEVCETVENCIRFHNRLVRWSQRVHGVRHCKLLRPFWDERKWPLYDRFVQFMNEEDGGYIRSDGVLKKLGRPFCENRGWKLRLRLMKSIFSEVEDDRPLYAYKLRRPQYKNAQSSGLTGEAIKETYRTIVRWTWLSSTVEF